jgi:hypothetical protein
MECSFEVARTAGLQRRLSRRRSLSLFQMTKPRIQNLFDAAQLRAPKIPQIV